MSTLPTAIEISPTNGLDLDEKCALEHFLGKTETEAEKLFFEAAEIYQEDLMSMGDKAFAYYLPALTPYLKSNESRNDSDIVNYLIGIIGRRLEFTPSSIDLAKESVLDLLNYCLDNYEKFDVIPEIYGNLKSKLEDLIAQIEKK